MNTTLRHAALALAILCAVPLSAAAQDGTWTATVREDGSLHFQMQSESSNWGRNVPLAELRGLAAHQIAAAASTPVAFRIEREAGVFELNGVFQQGRGVGHFGFHPNRGFAATLRSLGVSDAEELTERQLMSLAHAGTSAALVRELAALGFSPLRVRELVSASIHGVSPQYVRELRTLGYAELAPQDLVAMRIHRVTPEFIRELAALGYGGLSHRQLVQMRIHGVTPAFIREVRAAGFGDVPASTLVRMRIHRISPTGEGAAARRRD